MNDRSLVRQLERGSREWYDRFWNQGDVRFIGEFRTPDATASGLTFTSLDTRWAFALFSQSLKGALSSFQVRLVGLIVDLPYMAHMHVISGIHTGTSLGVPPTGRWVSIRGAALCEAPCGRVVRSWNAFDLYGLYRQIGACLAPIPDDLFAAGSRSRIVYGDGNQGSRLLRPEERVITRASLQRWVEEVWSGREISAPIVETCTIPTSFSACPPFDGHPGLHRLSGMVKLLRTGFPDIDVTIEQVLVNGEQGFVPAICRGHHTGPGLSARPTGRECALETFHWIDCSGGRISRVWSFIDLHALYSQLDILISLAPTTAYMANSMSTRREGRPHPGRSPLFP